MEIACQPNTAAAEDDDDNDADGNKHIVKVGGMEFSRVFKVAAAKS
jgi:hypothetical protein